MPCSSSRCSIATPPLHCRVLTVFDLPRPRALRSLQVNWQQPPRPVAECFTLNKLSLPKTQRKAVSRIKNNIW